MKQVVDVGCDYHIVFFPSESEKWFKYYYQGNKINFEDKKYSGMCCDCQQSFIDVYEHNYTKNKDVKIEDLKHLGHTVLKFFSLEYPNTLLEYCPTGKTFYDRLLSPKKLRKKSNRKSRNKKRSGNK